MRFEIGKVYTHSGGEMMMIVGEVETTMFGKTLVAESIDMTNLKPCGSDEGSAENWVEVPLSCWWRHWIEGNENQEDLHLKLREALAVEGTDSPPSSEQRPGIPWGKVTQ